MKNEQVGCVVMGTLTWLFHTRQSYSVTTHLEAFHFALVRHDNNLTIFRAIVQFLPVRPCLHILDLGTCPWELVHSKELHSK